MGLLVSMKPSLLVELPLMVVDLAGGVPFVVAEMIVEVLVVVVPLVVVVVLVVGLLGVGLVGLHGVVGLLGVLRLMGLVQLALVVWVEVAWGVQLVRLLHFFFLQVLLMLVEGC